MGGFLENKKYLVLDYETRSEADLKKVGSWEYSVHPSTEIICAAWRYGTREELAAQLKTKAAAVWSPMLGTPRPDSLVFPLIDKTVGKVAHNALFEQVITRNVLKLAGQDVIPPEEWYCTASLARALALPGSLEGACAALGLAHQKDMDGRRLLLKMCKPRKATKDNKSKWHETPEQIKRLMAYCQKDVDAETELFLKLPPLSPYERKIWCLDQRINLRGFQVDRELVSAALDLIKEETARLNAETDALTFGEIESTTQRDRTLKWLNRYGADLPDVKAKTVQDALKRTNLPDDVRALLEIRAMASKSSTAKYEAFEMRSRFDGRVRDNLVYWGASTGRWSGAGVQPQNFPRGTVKVTEGVLEAIRERDLEMLRLLYGSPMDALSSALRGCIVATPGKEFDCGDYAGIEARVLFWVAKHEEGLAIFRDGRDIYKEMAGAIYKIPPAEVKKDSKERWLGKTAILGLGYNMGVKKFMETCESQGQAIEEELAQTAVTAYRSTHVPVVKAWSNVEKAAKAAVQNPGKKYTVNRTSWWVANKFLWCELPSGRRLAYYGPTIRMVKTSWGEMRPALYHWGVNSVTKKWENAGTYGGRLVENCFTKETLVFTSNGLKPIVDLTQRDMVFDGSNWVGHDGVIWRGRKKVVTFLGVRATPDHLITDGVSWKPVTHWDGSSWDVCLSWAQNSARSLFSKPNLEKTQKYYAYANAVNGRTSTPEAYIVEKKLNARIAVSESAGIELNLSILLDRYSLQKRFSKFGGFDTLGLLPDVTTLIMSPFQTMVGAALKFLQNGKKIHVPFSSTLKPFHTGINRVLTWTVSIIRVTMPRAIYDLYQGKLTRVIDAQIPFFSTKESHTPRRSSTSVFALDGQAGAQSFGTSKKEHPHSKSSEHIENVYDVLNAGPSRQFMILTEKGPLIVHNCVQAISRDLMADAMLRAEAEGRSIVLSVHDELLAERNVGEKVARNFETIMATLPSWADGLPVKVEAWSGTRYRK